VLRLDLIHPVVSGNKWFKLKYHLQQALKEKRRGIISFGGAYSNHLVAAAWAAQEAGVASIGIIRGEQPKQLSPALKDMQQYNMQLRFVSRHTFANKAGLVAELQQELPDHFIIPQGGQSGYGVQGAAEILQLVSLPQYTHIACATGTGTMMAGIVKSSLSHQQVAGISSVKMESADNNSISAFIEEYSSKKNWNIYGDYHFGGYAKHSPELIRFMNEWYQSQGIPTDFVYTAKLFFAVNHLVSVGHFLPGSRLLLIHSGGLQGNRSLAPGTLTFQ
jgi:1-aminocyclopropane-1-carboxylate deaminase